MTTLLRSMMIAVLFSTVCTAAEPAPPVSLRTQFLRMCDSAAAVVAAELGTYRSLALTAESDTFSAFYTPLIAYGLSARGLPAAPDAPHLYCLVRDAAVEYGEPFSDSFFGPRWCTRTLQLDLALRGALPSGASGRVTITLRDSVRVADIPMLEEAAPPRTSVVRPERSWLDEILEPAIVTAASGVVIYLFFTIRS